MKLVITKIYRSTKDKNGKDFVNKDGNPYERVAIRCQEYGERWLSGFGARWNEYWKEGSAIDVEVEPKGEYLNFKRLDPIKELRDVVFGLEKRVLALEMIMGKEKKDEVPFVDEGKYGEPVKEDR